RLRARRRWRHPRPGREDHPDRILPGSGSRRKREARFEPPWGGIALRLGCWRTWRTVAAIGSPRVEFRKQSLAEDDQVIAVGVEVREHAGVPVAVFEVEAPGRLVMGQRRGLDQEEPPLVTADVFLHGAEQ